MTVGTQKQKGFTIVELLLVIVVIAILAAIAIVSYQNIQQKARDAQRRSDIASIAKALEVYYATNGQYPVGLGSTEVINNGWSTTADASWQNLINNLAPYATNIPSDPVSTPGANVTSSATTGYNYAYFSNTGGVYCGAGPRQMFILVYRYESAPREIIRHGECSSDELSYSQSYYRVVKQ